MTHELPMTLVAQLDDVAIFQTAAFVSSDVPEPQSCDTHQQGQASYGALNLGLHVNDDAAQVLNNRMRLLTAINEYLHSQQRASVKRLHWVNQVHGKDIYDIDSEMLGMQPMAADAMVSQQNSLGLAIMTADCVPVVLYQPVSGQIAAIHAGWQGLACGIIQATAQRFAAVGPIMAWMGACISQENYEVGKHVRDQLLVGGMKNGSLLPANLDNFDDVYVTTSNTERTSVEHLHKTVDKLSNYATVNASKVKLNLPKIAADQLAAVGVTLCTDLPVTCSYEDKHYYSYRRQTHLQQLATGRMALVIVRSACMDTTV